MWLTAFNLRVVMFAIPPALPAIRSELGLSFSATGSITSLMVLSLGIASIPGALLAGRFGARRLVSIGTLGLVAATASLTLPPAILWLFAGAALVALCIALAQPPLSVLIRRWFPHAMPRATSLYGNGLLLGNVAGGSLAPFLVHLVGWRSMFLIWGAFVLAGALLWSWLTPRDEVGAPKVRLVAIIRDRRVWQVAALFTFQNLAYYTVASWLPFLVNGRGPGFLAVTLLFLNCIPILPLMALSVVRWQYAVSTTFYAATGLITAAGSLGLLFGLTDLAGFLAFLVGLGAAGAFVGSLALPPMLADDESSAAGFSAVMFTAGYVLAFAGPVTAGILVDLTGRVTNAFWPALISGVIMVAMGTVAPRGLRTRTPAHAG